MQIHQNEQSERNTPRASLFYTALICISLSACATTGKIDRESFESANLRMMEASITRDQEVIQPMLAPDFNWREDDAPLTETPFEFWNRQNLWGTLNKLLNQTSFDSAGLKIAPRDAKNASYTGPRLAWRKVGDEWRLAYFYAGSNPQ